MPEKLFHAIDVHFRHSCQQIVFDQNEVLLCPDGIEFCNDLCTDFDSYCFTATMLKEKQLYNKLGCTLSKASALVGPIIQAEHPRSLAYFFEVFIHLTQSGLFEVTLEFRNFVRDMSGHIRGKKDSWSQIYQLLSDIDLPSFVHVVAQSWRCATDVLEHELGNSHRLAVSARLDYVKRIMETNHSEEERLLRELLSRFEHIPAQPTPRVMLNLAQNMTKQGIHHEAEKIARTVSRMLQQHEICTGRITERIEALKVLSHSQVLQRRMREAEATIREAVVLIINHWGRGHPWAIEFLNVLESWLRSWDRIQEANALREEIKSMVEPMAIL